MNLPDIEEYNNKTVFKIGFWNILEKKKPAKTQKTKTSFKCFKYWYKTTKKQMSKKKNWWN